MNCGKSWAVLKIQVNKTVRLKKKRNVAILAKKKMNMHTDEE